MLVKNIDLRNILPTTFYIIQFDLKDYYTLNIVNKAFQSEYPNIGFVFDWTDRDSRNRCVDIEFNTEANAVMFMLRLEPYQDI